MVSVVLVVIRGGTVEKDATVQARVVVATVTTPLLAATGGAASEEAEAAEEAVAAPLEEAVAAVKVEGRAESDVVVVVAVMSGSRAE
jgi:hypothetical protein